MRQKMPKTVITFATTSDAMAFEAASRDDAEALPGRIIPVPSEISAGCGLSWAAPVEQRDVLFAGIESKGLSYEGEYTIEMY